MPTDDRSRWTRIFSLAAAWSGLGHRPPVRPWRRLVNRLVSLVGLAYLALLAFPGLLFAHQVTHGSFQVYSDEPLGPELAAILERAAIRLDGSPLADPGMENRLFVCNGRPLRIMLAPLTFRAFGSTYPGLLRRNTILNRVELAGNLAHSDAATHNRRPLDSVIAHERTHALIGRRLGDLRVWTIPEWKTEGYCEQVAGFPSFDPAEGKRLIAAGLDDGSASFRYFRYGLMVRSLVELGRVDVRELFDRSFDEAEVMEQVRANLGKL